MGNDPNSRNTDLQEASSGGGASGNQSLVQNKFIQALSLLAFLFALYLTSHYNYLLFHSLAEFFSVVIAFGIFMIAWNSRSFTGSGYFLFLGVAYLFVGGLDMIHTLAYTGMGVFHEADTNYPTQIWIAARYMESISLLAGVAMIGRKPRVNAIVFVYAAISSLVLATVFYWNIFPECFVAGAGLTPFKKVSEYVIASILIAAIFALYRKREEFDTGVIRLLIASIVITICSELSFTLYVDAYGLANLVGHLLKVVSFYLIYKAIIEISLTKPYDLLFRNLKRNEQAIRKSEGRYRKLSENLEAMVVEKVAELRQAESLASMGRMVSTVAHEVRNPLQNIQMGVDSLRVKVEGDQDKVELLEEIRYGVDTLNKIIRELLEYSKPLELHRSAMSVKEIVERSLKETSHRLDGIVTEVELEQGDRELFVDVVKIVEVLVNLISNAVEAMPKGGTLSIRSRFCDEDGTEVIRLCVSDNGCGITEENLARIYEPFFTTKPRGTGLGIPTCKKIIAAQNGRINFAGKPNEGTTVEIVLPALESEI